MLSSLHAFAQIDSVNMLRGVVITGFSIGADKQTSLHIERLDARKLDFKSPFNLSDALTRVPGVSQMTTGNAISKPVIRGLYGNRVLVLLSGLRFDNQQWQDEHGLGLSQIGIDRVELIKGPVSLLYGTDAIGGVINVIEEQPDTAVASTLDVNTRVFSNTLGTLTDVGYKHTGEKIWWRLRGGYESHADYSDGRGQRVLNSRNTGYTAKAGFGFAHPKWKQENTYNFSYNQFGFILEGLNDFFAPDARWTRAMNGPHHIVALHIFNSQNTFYRRESEWRLNLGVQSNERMEDEGGGQISLDMRLLSALEQVKWEKELSRSVRWIVNQQFVWEQNHNYGGRKIVPDAQMNEGNLSTYLSWHNGAWKIETGLGGNARRIHTFPTITVNDSIQPFDLTKPSVNGMLGVVFSPMDSLFFKANASTGFRSGNLAELASNGLHEGVYRYEIGDPELRNEQNLNGELSVDYSNARISFGVAGYYNRFFNYIYLSPTNETWLTAFPIYRYRQRDAALYGGEADVKLKLADWLSLNDNFSIVYGVLDGVDTSNQTFYLPFIPAPRNKASLRFEKSLNGVVKNIYVEPEYEYAFAQNRPAQFETPTPAYGLLNTYAGLDFGAAGQYTFTVAATNLLNEAYADHLSRLKYYGLLNMGRNFAVAFKMRFDLKK